MNIDLLKQIGEDTAVKIPEVKQEEVGVSLMTVVFHLPAALQNKDGYAISRYHGGQVDKITEEENADGESMTVNAAKDTITAQLKKFSTYSIAYTESTGGDGGGGGACYTITASAGNDGSISPDGKVSVTKGGSKTFTITADKGYRIAEVLVDGKSVGAVSTYTFTKVTGGHTISAAFAERESVADPADTGVSKLLETDEHAEYLHGYTDGNFGPYATITRAEVTTIVNRMLGRRADADDSDAHAANLLRFPDVPKSHLAYEAICEATNAHGYTKSEGAENWTSLKQ